MSEKLKRFLRDRTILARNEEQGKASPVGLLMKPDSTNFPIGFPPGLAIVSTTEGGEAGFADPYLTTPVNVPLDGTWTDDTDVDSSDVTEALPGDVALAKKFEIAAGHAAADLISTQVITSADYSSQDVVILYIEPSIDLDAGDLEIGMSATATLGGSPVFDDVPACKADTMNIVTIPVSGLPSATISVGFRQAVDKGAYEFTIYHFGSFIFDGSNAAIGVLKDWVSFQGLLNEDSNNNGETGKEAVYFTSGNFLYEMIIGIDSAGITDLDGRLTESDTILIY